MDNTHRSWMRLGRLTVVLALLQAGLFWETPFAAEVAIWGHAAHPTRVLARFKAGEGVITAAGAMNQGGLKVLGESSLVPGLVTLDLADPAALAAAAALPAEAQQKQLLRRLETLRQSGLFEYAEPDYIRRTSAVPNDSAFTDGTLWGLRNTGQDGGVAGIDIGAVQAWDITTGSASVLVAVIDTGIRYTHQDLAAQMWRNPGEIAGNGIDDDGNGYVDDVHGINAINGSGNPMDDNDHGTHVSGTIGGVANAGGRIVGVAWQVRLMACKFLDASGSGATSDAIKCIDYATARGARIMNNSWGGGGFSQALHDSILAARNAGALFVAAAGNAGTDNDVFPQYPANYQLDNVISVAAIDRTGALAPFSCYGRNTVHIGAPGVAIYSSTAESDSSYDSFNGTSMATPHVAGVAALLVARYPGISLAELRQRLLIGAVPTPALANTTTGGRLNALNSLNVAADGILEVAVTPANGAAVERAASVRFQVAVHDLAPVLNATVTATVAGSGSFTFVNNGTGPDAVAGDHVYSQDIAMPTGVANLELSIQVTAPGKSPATTSVTYSFIVRPPNDAFASRISIPGNGGTASGSNSNATRELDEPLHAGNSGGKSVWWTWTASSNGLATVTTVGSNFDTILGVYLGGAVGSLTEVAGNDDSGAGLQSLVTFSATAGTTYQIAVDGYSGSFGSIQLNVSPAGGGGGGGGGGPLSDAVDAPSFTFQSGGGATWFRQSIVTHDGVDAAQSGDINDSGESWMTTTVAGPGEVRFWSRIASEESYDYLEFYIDGMLQPGRISGYVNWFEQVHAISDGMHELRWRYVKDGSVSTVEDAAWVDQLRVTPGRSTSSEVWYVTSSAGLPWGSVADVDSLNRVFGVGGWTATEFQSVHPTNLFGAGSRLVFMDGSDEGANEMETFIAQNRVAMQDWVAGGGSLFLNAAPNSGDGMDMGFGVSLSYNGVRSIVNVNAALPGHPVFNGPDLPVGSSWTGNNFAHGFINGPGLVTLLLDADSSAIVLGERAFGNGHVFFGSMTVPDYHEPTLEAHNLRANFFAYLNAVAPIDTNSPPVITSHPRSLTVGPGSTVQLSVAAIGVAPLAYQWRHNGVNIPGATGTNLVLNNVQPAQAGPYTVLVSNPRGSTISSPGVVTVMSGELHMGLTIHGAAGAQYRIDYQTVVDGPWQFLTTLVLPQSTFIYVDPQPASLEQRFYRAVLIE